jgi:hypothetical protein
MYIKVKGLAYVMVNNTRVRVRVRVRVRGFNFNVHVIGPLNTHVYNIYKILSHVKVTEVELRLGLGLRLGLRLGLVTLRCSKVGEIWQEY